MSSWNDRMPGASAGVLASAMGTSSTRGTIDTGPDLRPRSVGQTRYSRLLGRFGPSLSPDLQEMVGDTDAGERQHRREQQSHVGHRSNRDERPGGQDRDRE